MSDSSEIPLAQIAKELLSSSSDESDEPGTHKRKSEASSSSSTSSDSSSEDEPKKKRRKTSKSKKNKKLAKLLLKQLRRSKEKKATSTKKSNKNSVFGTILGERIDKKLDRRIKKNRYVKIGELNNNTSGKDKNNNLTYLEWEECFDIFITRYIAHHKHRYDSTGNLSAEMMTYKARVRNLYKMGYKWRDFDEHFRRDFAGGPFGSS